MLYPLEALDEYVLGASELLFYLLTPPLKVRTFERFNLLCYISLLPLFFGFQIFVIHFLLHTASIYIFIRKLYLFWGIIACHIKYKPIIDAYQIKFNEIQHFPTNLTKIKVLQDQLLLVMNSNLSKLVEHHHPSFKLNDNRRSKQI